MPCVPANCLLCGGSASITLNRKCKYLKRRTTARLGRGARPGRVWDGFTCRKNWHRTFGFGSKSAQILHPMPSSFPTRKVGLWTPAIIENGCYISWHETSGCPSLSDHPKPANEYHLKTGQREQRLGH